MKPFHKKYLTIAAIWPTSTLDALGRIFGALSLFALFQYATTLGLSTAFKTVIEVYLVALRASVGLLDPVARYIVNLINSVVPFHVTFAEGWRHIFVILQILFIRDAKTAFSDGRPALGCTRLVVGVFIAFLTAVLAFVSNIGDPLFANVIFCLVPVLGLFVYDIIMYAVSATLFFDAVGVGEMAVRQTPVAFFWTGVSRSILRLTIVGGASLLIFVSPEARALAFPHGGLIAMTVGLIANAAYWMCSGSSYAYSQWLNNRSFTDAFLTSESGRFGLSVLGLLFWFLVFCLMNAGARILGF